MSLATEVWHGTYGGYTNHACRCDECKSAGAAHRARYLSDPANRATHAAGGAANYIKNRAKRREAGNAYYASGRQRDLRYGLKPGQFDEMLSSQQNRCAICLTEFGGGLTPHVDHDHSCCSQGARSCGKCVRGLLCGSCNLTLGHSGDNVDRLRRAAEYLENKENNHG